jgi:hypothetical protein
MASVIALAVSSSINSDRFRRQFRINFRSCTALSLARLPVRWGSWSEARSGQWLWLLAESSRRILHAPLNSRYRTSTRQKRRRYDPFFPPHTVWYHVSKYQLMLTRTPRLLFHDAGVIVDDSISLRLRL